MTVRHCATSQHGTGTFELYLGWIYTLGYWYRKQTAFESQYKGWHLYSNFILSVRHDKKILGDTLIPTS